ncbi:MAG TPA: DUF5667 domain-containing protein [Kribbellaceae bacterium]|nr:DUF5667 domain-containing protein [Kribbellaceae bacterium]
MGDLNRARRRAEEFARLLEDGTQQAPGDPELDEALSLVSQLRAAGAVRPSPEFSATLREQLLERAADRITATPIERPDRDDEDEEPVVTDLRASRRRRGRLIAGVAAFVAIGGGIGSAAAAQESMPGDALYGLKRSLEAVATKVSVTEESRGRRELSHALVRLTEIEQLVATGGEPAEINNTLHDFTSEARSGGEHLLAAFQADNDAASVDRIYTFTGEARSRLTALAPSSPQSTRPALAEAIATLDQLTLRAHAICPACDSPKSMSTTEPTTVSTPTDQQRPTDTTLPSTIPSAGPTTLPSVPRPTGRPSTVATGTPVQTILPTRGPTGAATSTPTIVPTIIPTLPTTSLPTSDFPTLTLPTFTLSVPLLPAITLGLS